MEDVDDILFSSGSEESEVEKSEKDVKSSDDKSPEVKPEKLADVFDGVSEGDDDGFPKFRGGDCPQQFQDLLGKAKEQYDNLPKLNFEELYEELVILAVKTSQTPTLQVINDEIIKVQGAKDRLAQIIQDVDRCFTLKKRIVNLLSEAWGKYSNGASADKRKSDTSFRISDFIIDLSELEALKVVCDHVSKNLESQHYSLSRRITVIQMQLKLHDFGKSALPQYDFQGSPIDEFKNDFFHSDNSMEKSDDYGESTPAEKLDF